MPGAVVGALVGALLVLRARHVDLWQWADIILPGALVAAIGLPWANLAEGQMLTVKRRVPGQQDQEIADVQVGTVASTSAVCDIKSSTQDIQPGDMAFLSAHDVELLRITRESKESKKYPQVVSFSEGDPLEAELRTLVSHVQCDDLRLFASVCTGLH